MIEISVCHNLIIRKEVLDELYPGGTTAFENKFKNSQSDNNLIGFVGMSLSEFEKQMDELEKIDINKESDFLIFDFVSLEMLGEDIGSYLPDWLKIKPIEKKWFAEKQITLEEIYSKSPKLKEFLKKTEWPPMTYMMIPSVRKTADEYIEFLKNREEKEAIKLLNELMELRNNFKRIK